MRNFYPEISVIVLNFNRKRDLQDLLISIYNQSYRKYEVIVVDNNSEDKSVELVSSKFPKVRLLVLEKNIGRAGHNEGAKEAQGDILIFLDADIFLPDEYFLEKVIRKFQKKSIDAVSFYMDNPKGGYGWEPTYLREGSKKEGFKSTFGGGMWAIRKNIFEKVGGFNPRFFVYVDEWEYLVRLWRKGYAVRYFPDLRGIHKESPYSYRSVMKGYHVIVNHAQMLVLYIPFRYWPKFFSHYFRQTVLSATISDVNKWGLLKGVLLAGVYMFWSLPKRSPLDIKTMNKFLKFYFPDRKYMIVGKWGWQKNEE